jgi:hypothetical protein
MATTTKPRGMAALSMDELLERGWPGELLDGARDEAVAAAQWYVADERKPESARARVLAVWIEGSYQPAWDAREVG